MDINNQTVSITIYFNSHGEVVFPEKRQEDSKIYSTFYKCCGAGTKSSGKYASRLTKAQNGGIPFFKFNFQLSTSEYEKFLEELNAYRRSETCIGSATYLLSKSGCMTVPYPINQLPLWTGIYLTSLYVRGKFLSSSRVESIEFIGKIKKKPAIMLPACFCIETGVLSCVLIEQAVVKTSNAFQDLTSLVVHKASQGLNLLRKGKALTCLYNRIVDKAFEGLDSLHIE